MDENTTDVFLECALDPLHIAKTGRALGIHSDARYRFERGVDPGFVESGAAIAIKMIVALCGGTPSQITIAGKNPFTPKAIPFRPARVTSLCGIAISEQECLDILQALGFKQSGQHIEVPSFRPDISGEADLVEEVARIKGYSHIPSTPLPQLASLTKSEGELRHNTHILRRTWAARGLSEAVTWSFLPEKEAALFGWSNPALSLQNPISAELDTMRPSLLPNLIGAARRNGVRGHADLALFEAGNVFSDATPQGQDMHASAIRTGKAVDRNPHMPSRPVDVRSTPRCRCAGCAGIRRWL